MIKTTDLIDKELSIHRIKAYCVVYLKTIKNLEEKFVYTQGSISIGSKGAKVPLWKKI